MLFLWFLAGFSCLIYGAHLSVKGGVSLAHHFKLSPLLIGIVLTGFGSSMPEMVASVGGALAGSDGIAIGNVVGSNIANILLILGVVALFTQVRSKKKTFFRDSFAVISSAGLLMLAALYGTITRPIGALYILLLLFYVYKTYTGEKVKETKETVKPEYSILLSSVLAVSGIAITILGGHIVVLKALMLSRSFGISEAVIGLTIVGVGTSLPEFFISLIAAIKKQYDISLGNIIGSVVFNTLGILGTASLIKPLHFDRVLTTFDTPFYLGTAVLLILLLVRKHRLARAEGLLMLACYGVYLYAQFMRISV